MQFVASVWLQLLDMVPYATALLSALERSCCHNYLVHYQDKLLQLQRFVLSRTSLAAREELVGCPSLIKVRAISSIASSHIRCLCSCCLLAAPVCVHGSV